MRRRYLRPILPAIFALLVTAENIASLEAQDTKTTFYAIVHDESTGAVLPGINVTLLNQETNITTQSVTNDRGEVLFSALPPRRYTITVTRE
jgi:Carboxypeptidase regulatory-like domain